MAASDVRRVQVKSISDKTSVFSTVWWSDKLWGHFRVAVTLHDKIYIIICKLKLKIGYIKKLREKIKKQRFPRKLRSITRSPAHCISCLCSPAERASHNIVIHTCRLIQQQLNSLELWNSLYLSTESQNPENQEQRSRNILEFSGKCWSKIYTVLSYFQVVTDYAKLRNHMWFYVFQDLS